MDIPREDLIKKKRKRRLLLGALGATCLIGVSIALARLEPLAISADRNTLLIGTVRSGEFVRLVRGPGVLSPREVRWVATETAARVERLLLKPGAKVEPDSVIVELSNPELELRVSEATAAQAQGDAELAALRLQLVGQVLDQKARVAEARATYEGTRLQSIAEAEAGNAISKLQAQRTLLLAEQYRIRAEVETERLANMELATAAQLRAQRANLDQVRNTLLRQQQQFASLKVTAGMRGVLQALPVQQGQQLAAGTSIARIASPDDLIAVLKVPELQAKDLVPGLKAQIDTRAGIIPGVVSRIDPAVEEGTVRVEIDLSGALPAGSRPDLSVDGVIEIERASNNLVVSRPAYGQSESKVSVFKLQPDGARARRVAVQFGKESVQEIAVVSGLKVGDQIIVSDISQWSSYDEINIR